MKGKKNEKYLDRLISAKEFLNKAKSHMNTNNNSDLALAVLCINLTLEYIVKVLAQCCEVDFGPEDSLKYIYGRICKQDKYKITPPLPRYDRFETLRIKRNEIQHNQVIPCTEVDEWYEKVESFFKTISTTLDICYETLDISELIKTPICLKLIKEADEIKNSNTEKAISLLRDSFDNAKYIFLNKIAFQDQQLLDLDDLEIFCTQPYTAKIAHRALEHTLLQSLGINLLDFNIYLDTIQYVHYNLNTEASIPVKETQYNIYDYVKVRSFVVNSILNMENKIEVNTSLSHQQYPIKRIAVHYTGCINRKLIYWFDVTQEGFELFKNLTSNSPIPPQIVDELDEVKINSDQTLYLYNIITRVLTNNPPLYRVTLSVTEPVKICKPAENN
ncbi:MAG: hypothetical protein J6F30_06625 [Cellulosilyticum sp.]|nr:hypothetical protein [Cellulosilyticum sp.]